jgi:hypothetical protein
MTGYRESELVTICNNVHPNIVVPFLIYECTGYYDKNRPDWEQMQKLAIDVSVPRARAASGFKTGVGFSEIPVPIRVGADDDEDDEDDD